MKKGEAWFLGYTVAFGGLLIAVEAGFGDTAAMFAVLIALSATLRWGVPAAQSVVKALA